MDIAKKIRATLLLLRSSDTSSETGRSADRVKKIGLTAAAAGTAKAVSIGTALISVPLTLHYLGAERYGMWMTISSLSAVLAFADLGLGNGILTKVAAAHGRDDREAIRKYISSGFIALSAICITIICATLAAYPIMHWENFFNVKSELARQEANPAILVFIVCFALAIPTGIVQRTQMALQQGFVASLWQCAGSVLSFLAVISAITLKLSLPWLVGAFVAPPLVVSALNSFIYFGTRNRDIAPRLQNYSAATAREIATTGMLFLVLQIVVSATYASDNILISHFLGAASVSGYAVPEKLFSLISVAIGMFLSPLWPAYREAISRRDVAWARHALRNSLALAVSLAATASIMMLALSPHIVKLWVGAAIKPTFFLLLGFSIWKVLETVGNCLGVFLNGLNVVKVQVIISAITAAIAVTLKCLLIPHMGVAGAVWGTIISFTICALIPYSLIVPKLIENLDPHEQ